ncbi:arsenate reductase family protein [Mariniflexile ostreae]|uniref:Arsenate reductase family protein n=1 Tax=Mariniflexile ostreae TaxID=1520892 RepID=A0ABV5F8Q3_9FLAO
MPILARDKKQITLIYSSLSQLGKQVLGYVQAADKKIETIDIAKETLSGTIWVELADNLNLPFHKIFETDYLQEKINTEQFADFNSEDWIKIINNNPVVLQKPIAINGDRAMVVTQRSEIMTFFGVDSAGLKKTMNHQTPTISPTTDDESFI